MKRRKLKFLPLVLVCLLFWLPSMCSASRLLTEEQYQRLMYISQRQEEISATLNNELTVSEKTLTEQQKALEECQSELITLKKELANSKSQTEELKNLLQKANDSQKKAEQSLKDYQKLMTNKLKTAKRQRNFWSVVAGVAVAGFLVKR